jgi:hypothetical protein
MKKARFFEAGAFQVVATASGKGRNNASNHTHSPCPCHRRLRITRDSVRMAVGGPKTGEA